MEYNIYKLTSGNTAVSHQLPLKEVFVKKFVEKNGKREDLGYRRIKYVPGTDTIFAEDIKGDLKPQSLWFLRGEIRVLKDDKLLNLLMTSHPWYGKRYELWSTDIEDERKLAELRFKAEARQLIDEADKEKIKAIALAVFGAEAIGWSDDKCELQLREEADTKPKDLKTALEDKDYEAKLLAGLAFVHNICKENIQKTAVVWSDSEGVILKLAKGEKGITELGRYLSNHSEESELVLQSIGERLDALVGKATNADKDVLLSEQEQEIARLRAELAKASKTEDRRPKTEDNALQEARDKYKAKFKKHVPVNKKNDLEWINNRLGVE